jgi:polyisoprenoid-binding protein YceI
MDLRRALRRPRTWIIAVPLLALVAVTAGPFVYINFIKDDPPARLGFGDLAAADDGTGGATTTTTAPASPATAGDAGGSGVDGTWHVAAGSVVGYRVTEVLFGQDTEGVGRSDGITGTFAIDGTTVTDASFEVDMTTFESDESRRDSQFDGRIMDVDTFPTSTFTLTRPIELGELPADLEEVHVQADGDLTLRGRTKPVTFDLVARRNGANIEITGSLTVVFDEWGIPNPSNAAVSTDDEGLLELALVLTR